MALAHRGSAFAVIGWVVVSNYSRRDAISYNKTYGSLGAVIDLTTWKWLSSIVVLLGTELNAMMAHDTASDTTRESPCACKRCEKRGGRTQSGEKTIECAAADGRERPPCRIFKLGCTCDIFYSILSGRARALGVTRTQRVLFQR